MTADLYSFPIPFMADRSSVFPFDFEKRLGSFFLGVSLLGKPQKRKLSSRLFCLLILPGDWAVVSAPLGTEHLEVPLMEEACKEQSGSLVKERLCFCESFDDVQC